MIDKLLENLDRHVATGEPALPLYKQTLHAGRQLLAEQFEQGAGVKLLVTTAARFTDALLQRVWTSFVPADTPASLIAVGGYGRGELHPGSDVDVLILTAVTPQALAEHLEPQVTFLWEIGLEITDGNGAPVTGTEDIQFNAWIARDDEGQSHFANRAADQEQTLGTLACGRSVIVAGAYQALLDTRPACEFSSEGPTRDNRYVPHISAPGRDVLAARSEAEGEEREEEREAGGHQD